MKKKLIQKIGPAAILLVVAGIAMARGIRDSKSWIVILSIACAVVVVYSLVRDLGKVKEEEF